MPPRLSIFLCLFVVGVVASQSACEAAFVQPTATTCLPIGRRLQRLSFSTLDTRRSSSKEPSAKASSSKAKSTSKTSKTSKTAAAPATPAKTTVAAATAADVATPVTYRKSDLVNRLQEKHPDLLPTKKVAETMVNSILEIIQEQVQGDDKITLNGFGTFSLQHRAARKGRNPQTGEEMDIAASDTPKFSAAKAWKDMVNGAK